MTDFRPLLTNWNHCEGYASIDVSLPVKTSESNGSPSSSRKLLQLWTIFTPTTTKA
jgi:hypothetical protein